MAHIGIGAGGDAVETGLDLEPLLVIEVWQA